MRDILFRGKRVDNGEWAEGDLTKDYSKNPIIISGIAKCGDGYDNCLGAIDYYYVIPETVGQYTGIKDKNGKRIFEGDILSTSNKNCKIWYVDWKLCAFCANQSNANYSCMLDEFLSTEEVEIIGNIHDNPELVEVQK